MTGRLYHHIAILARSSEVGVKAMSKHPVDSALFMTTSWHPNIHRPLGLLHEHHDFFLPFKHPSTTLLATESNANPRVDMAPRNPLLSEFQHRRRNLPKSFVRKAQDLRQLCVVFASAISWSNRYRRKVMAIGLLHWQHHESSLFRGIT